MHWCECSDPKAMAPIKSKNEHSAEQPSLAEAKVDFEGVSKRKDGLFVIKRLLPGGSSLFPSAE